MSVLALHKKFQKLPFGNWLFSRVVCFKAPYFGTVSPVLHSMEPGRAEVRFRRRRRVQNHIGTVHVIAICNGLEMAMGMVAEASIPKHLRWLPKRMAVDYPAKSETIRIRAIATVDPASFQKDTEVPIRVQALRDDDTVVVDGTITLWVTEKPQRA
ncbi:MAG: hotdog fold domain-containing protein [Granulosicoccaceae bacterium]